MAEEPPTGSYAIKYVCMHVCMYVINECVEMMPEVETGLNKAKIKVDVTLLVCVDFASLFCGLGKKNCGQRGDLF